MDSKKALFRAKLREAKQHQEKRIDSPLVRSSPPLLPVYLPSILLRHFSKDLIFNVEDNILSMISKFISLIK